MNWHWANSQTSSSGAWMTRPPGPAYGFPDPRWAHPRPCAMQPLAQHCEVIAGGVPQLNRPKAARRLACHSQSHRAGTQNQPGVALQRVVLGPGNPAAAVIAELADVVQSVERIPIRAGRIARHAPMRGRDRAQLKRIRRPPRRAPATVRMPLWCQAAAASRRDSKARSRQPLAITLLQYSRYLGKPPVNSVSPWALPATLVPRYQVLAFVSRLRFARL